MRRRVTSVVDLLDLDPAGTKTNKNGITEEEFAKKLGMCGFNLEHDTAKECLGVTWKFLTLGGGNSGRVTRKSLQHFETLEWDFEFLLAKL